jgi:hypothetical protein
MQQHFLVIAGGFSHGDAGPIQVSFLHVARIGSAIIISTSQTIKTTVNVGVHIGIKPASDGSGEEDDDENSTEITFVPWRVGSERHLGIQRSSGSISTPPPAYF